MLRYILTYEILAVFIFGALGKSANSTKIKSTPNIWAIQYTRLCFCRGNKDI